MYLSRSRSSRSKIRVGRQGCALHLLRTKATATAEAKAGYLWVGGVGPVAGDAASPPPGPGPAAGGCAFGRLRSSASQAKRPHPCKLGRRIHAAHAPSTGPTPPSTNLRDLSALHSVDPRHAWMLFVRLSKYSNSMEIHPRMAWIYQIAEICRRRGGVGVRGVSRMDAAAKPTWTYLRRPRTPTPPRYHTEIALWLLLLPLLECFGGCRAAGPADNPYFALAICFSMSAAVTGPRKVCASLPCGSSRCVNGRPRGVAKSVGGSNGSTITIG